MSRMYGVAQQADERFDEAGFEIPFVGTLEGEALPPRARPMNLPTGKDEVSRSHQPQTQARLCAPGANLVCPGIPELWVSSTIEGVPFYYGAVVKTVEGTGGKRKALVRAENKSYKVRLIPNAWRAAQRWITSMSSFGMPIAAVITAGAGPYCRCIKTPKGVCRHDNPGGCTGTRLSNHGAGDAIDITGVMWKDHHGVGSSLKVTLMHSWSDAAEQAPLLVRINAALRLSFATVIDYSDSGHRDHFHVDTNNGVARNVFEMEAERWFLAGCLRSLGYIQHHARPPAWAEVQPGLAAFARQVNIAVPAGSDKNAWRAIVERVYGCIALGGPAHCIRKARPEREGQSPVAGRGLSTAGVALGTLRHTSKDGKTLNYKFTEDDLVWTARYLTGEAGDDVERTAVLWAMLNRFAFYRALGRGWRTFAALLRAYSSPLQYPLNSVGAAYRHWKNCPGPKCRFVDLSADYGYYDKTMNGQRVPKGQLRPFIDLQKKGWERLNAGVRRVAANVLSGAAPNNVGLATEFADTAVFWRDHHRGAKGPTRAQWLEYTKAYAAQKKYIWASDTAPYDQYRRNVLFIQAKFRDETLPVVVASQARPATTPQPELETSFADTHHARGARDAFEYEDESDTFQGESFDSPEHVLLGTPAAERLGAAAPPGIQKVADGWAMRGLIDGGAFIDTGAMKFLTLDKPANPIKEWKIFVPRAVTGGAATAPYAGQSIPAAARWHWIAPDPVFRRPGERWTADSLRAALLAGEAVALNLGQIIMLAGDLVATFSALKTPGGRSDAVGSMVGFHRSDPYSLVVYSQLSPKPHRAGITGAVSDDLGSLNALREPKGLQDMGKSFGLGNSLYEKQQRSLHNDPPAWVKDLRMFYRLLRTAGGPTGFSELHLLGQMMSVNQIFGFQIAASSPWLGQNDRLVLESSKTAPQGFDDRFFQELVTNGRFFDLASRNDTHFNPTNWTEFEKEFRFAMFDVENHIASRRSPHPIPADAVARLAYALHFLTDAFSSGHMRVPRLILGTSMRAKLMHDIDGELGLNVFNAFGSWRAFGDGKLKNPGALGTKILATLHASGIDVSPDANLRFAREAVGAAFKQLHYHAQGFKARSGTDHIRPVLDANRGAARDGVVGDDAAAGRPGDGANKDAWIDSHLEVRLQYLRKHKPQVYPVGRNWDTRRENHAPLFDEKGNLVGTGLYWTSKFFGNERFFKIRLPASGSEHTVKEYTKIYQLALNTPDGLPWLPRDPTFLQVFDKLPNADTLWGAARAAAAAAG